MGGRAGGGASGGMGSKSRSGASSWPTLTGSEKQVSWANDIRGRAQKALDFLKQNISIVPNTKVAKTVFSKWESKMKSMTSASQWIDARWDAPGKLDGNNSNYSTKTNFINTMSVFDNWLGH